MTRPPELLRIGGIQGIPLYYERRTSDDEWGDLAPEEQTNFYLNEDFNIILNKYFQEIRRVFGEPTGIISAGAWVDKPGMHRLGRAFDLDGIVWEEWKWDAREFHGQEQRETYLIIQAICMKYFGTVLGYLYNKAHYDHIHMDDGVEVGFRHNSRSVVSFIQAALNTFFDVGLVRTHLTVDGSWGPKTWGRMQTVTTASISQYPTQEQYFGFLNRIINRGLVLAEKEPVEPVMTDEERFSALERRVLALEEKVWNG
jgi:hypothetical protein